MKLDIDFRINVTLIFIHELSKLIEIKKKNKLKHFNIPYK